MLGYDILLQTALQRRSYIELTKYARYSYGWVVGNLFDRLRKKSIISFHWTWKSRQLLSLQWRHNEHGGVSNHQTHGCLLNRLFRRRSKKTPKLRVTGLCVGNSPGPVNSPHKGPVTRKNVSIRWRHHVALERHNIKENLSTGQI